MFTAAKRFSRHAWVLLWHLFASVASAHRVLFRVLFQQDATAVENRNPPKATLQRPPLSVQYRPIPGSWERARRPHWPDRVFKVPEQPDNGDIYYVTKGDLIRIGKTAIVELLPSGHIAKTPKMNHYYPGEEKENRQSMEREYSVYQMIGPSSFVPEMIAWDPESCVLTLKHCPNGDLESYIRKPDYDNRVNPDLRLRWMLQMSEALAAIHAAGLTHNDIAPRNFLLDENLDMRICDLAECSLPGGPPPTCSPGPRYESGAWSRDYIPTQTDDVFALGSVMYFVLSGEEPYSDLDDEEVERRFENREFPTSSHLRCGSVVQDCWHGRFSSTAEVVQALDNETGLRVYPKAATAVVPLGYAN